MTQESPSPSLPQALPPRLDQLPVGQPVSFALLLGDWKIPGEVLVAEAWQPELGLIDPERARFRLVFLTRPQEVLPRSLASSRVAVCIPLRGGLALREMGPGYQAGRPPPPTTPPPQEAYVSGQVVTQGGSLSAQGVFRSPELADWCQRLGSALFVPPGEAALAYARLVAPDIAKTIPDRATIEAVFPGHLRAVETRLAPLPAALERLTSALGPTSQHEFALAAEHLGRLARQPSYQDFYLAAESLYSRPSGLEADLSLLQKLEALAPHIPQIIAAQAYLEGAVIGDRDRELSVDRQSLLEQLAPDYLLANPHLWPSLNTLFQWFKSRYCSAYLTHFRRWQQQMIELQQLLQEKAAELPALGRLNAIGELGAPRGQELIENYQGLRDRVKPCPLDPNKDQPVDSVPVCPYCGLRLTDEAPTAEVNSFIHSLEQALQEQLRRLSSRAIHLILSHNREPRVKRFLQIAQASDLSSLPGVLDDELAAFIGQLLRQKTPSRKGKRA